MKSRHPITLMFFLTPLLLTSVSVQADALNGEQKRVLEQRLNEMSADEINHVRHDSQARLQFLRGIASSMTPQQREIFRDSWKAMTANERQQALHSF